MNLSRILKKYTISHQALIGIRSLSCWSCGNEVILVSNLFCSKCKALQNPDITANYFNVLGVKETYDLNEQELSKRFKDLQKYLHPDKFASRDQKELEISEKYSSLVNEAYKTLLEPLSRGIYMLRLRGKEISEDTESDQEFLMEIMDKNEQVENAETEKEIMSLKQENLTTINDLKKQLSIAFFEGDMKKVIRLLKYMKYYSSIDSQIQNIIRSKGFIQ